MFVKDIDSNSFGLLVFFPHMTTFDDILYISRIREFISGLGIVF